jgi:type IV pilus assembly protein PilY1
MRHYHILFCLLAAAFLASPALANPNKPPQVEEFNCNNYALTPPFLADAVAPSTTLIVDSSGSMNEHAYQEIEIDWVYSEDDVRPGSTGFNSTKEYYGYFDSYSYYSYNSTGDTEYFYPDASGEWSGNFMNWVSMHRTDIVRKVLTGGPYDTATSTYKVSRTDEGNQRGKYHVFDATNAVTDLNGNTKHVVPSSLRKKIGFVQTSDSDSIFIYSVSNVETASSPERWNIDSREDSFTLRVYSEKKYGLLDRFGYRMRLSLFRYDDDGSMNNGGKILNYMTSDPTDIKDLIDNIDTLSMDSWTPLAETLYTVCGYIRQVSSPYEKDSYQVGKSYPDPFYFNDLQDNIYCTQQNVILITDGESTQDKNIPDFLKDAKYDVGNNDGLTYPSEGSGYLDNVAYWAHTTDLRDGVDDLEGMQNINLYTIFAFGSGSQLLKDAAKWGGFNDKNNDNQPDTDEYDADGDGVPDNYFEASSGAELENALVIAFSSILNRVSSGSAASVVSTSRKGEGLLYQAVFWPERVDSNGNQTSWTGDVYAYWLDDNGIMHLDDGQNSSQKLADDDSKVTIWYDSDESESFACVGGTVVNGTCDGEKKSLTSIEHVWSASNWLNDNDLDPLTQRSSYNSAIGDDKLRRYIMTWNDDGNGKIESGEFTSFSSAHVNSTLCDAATINWMRGKDAVGLRSRTIKDENTDTNITWRLGDIITSSPTVVAAPAENYDLYWNDTSYGDFYRQYKDRRIMVYFGSNDGMLHAVNSGFYNQKDRGYYTHLHSNGTYSNNQGFDLGTEMWAYVPYNLQAHLACQTDPNYQHQYYVDLKPRVFDAKIFEHDDDHPNGWGTILICGFNFGGDGQQDFVQDSRYFGSSFFIFDVTNPEKEPAFLGELTFEGYTLGYAINQPTLVAIKDNNGDVHWYLLFATGPQTPAGNSTQKAALIVVPAKEIIDTSEDNLNQAKASFPLRLDSNLAKPSSSSIGVLLLSDSNSAMGTGLVSVDYNFDFFVDMMYYGTVVTPNKGDMTGGIHRLKVEAEPDPSKWERKEMTTTDGPLTGAPNVGFKDTDVWVYFGTGKFWDVSDKTDLRTQWMYGIQEPKFTNSNAYNFSSIPAGNLIDVTDFYVRNDGAGTLNCGNTANSTDCLPTGVTTVEELAAYIRDTNSVDGWKRAMPNTGERVIGQPTLFGGLTNFTTFTPSNDICTAEGTSTLYALYYLTGTAWKENVFGDSVGDFIPFTVDLGQGMGVSPSLHLGSEEGVRAFVQTSTGSIIEIHQPNLPIPNVKSGRGGWHTLGVD